MNTIRHVALACLLCRQIAANLVRHIELVAHDATAAGHILVLHWGPMRCVRVVTATVQHPDFLDVHLRPMTLLERFEFDASERKKEADRLANVVAFMAQDDTQ